MCRERFGVYYYRNLCPLHSEWTRTPPPPPPTMPDCGWSMFWCPDSGKPYFFDELKGVTYWEPRRPKNVLLIGDSALQLNKSRGTTGFDKEFNDFLNENCALGPGACGDVRRFPGATGVELLGELRNTCEHDIDCVGFVWMLNEFQSRKSMDPSAVAHDIASSMRRFRHKFAVIGGSSYLWGFEGDKGMRFDALAQEIRSIFASYEIHAVDGVDLYLHRGLTYERGSWHIKTDGEGLQKAIMAMYYGGHVISSCSSSSTSLPTSSCSSP